MKRVALVVSEPIRPAMGGIGVRYLEMTRHLLRLGFDAIMVSPSTIEEAAGCGLEPRHLVRFETRRLGEILADREVVVTQGQLANDVLSLGTMVPVVVDLYDPWLVENLHYAEELGFETYRNDHASWVLQLASGDLFLTASAEQRLFLLGFLAALGRVNPERMRIDPDLSRLIAIVPFGCAGELPPRRPLLPPRGAGERRILFGGVYDWYDTSTMLLALDRLSVECWTLLVVRHPNPESTPQRAFAELERESRRRGWWGTRVAAIEWVPADRRYDLLAEVDLLAAPHRPSFESELAFRTRFLDALAVGCPAVATQGGTLARLLHERGAGWTVPPANPEALASTLAEVLRGGPGVAARIEAGRRLAAEHSWERVLTPLVDFLERPAIDSTKQAFAFRPPSRSPAEPRRLRLRRFLRRRVGI